MKRVMNISEETVEEPWYAFQLKDVSCWICESSTGCSISSYSHD